MTKADSKSHDSEVTSRLRAQNRRYRELVQNLSSAIDVLRKDPRLGTQRTLVLSAFESFKDEARPVSDLPHGQTEPGANRRRAARSPERNAVPELRALVPNPGWKCLAVDQPQMRIGFTLFGMSADEIEEAVEVVEQRQVRSRDFTPVFITDGPDFAPFRSRGYVVEFVSTRASSDEETDPSKRRTSVTRIEQIMAKWGLGELVHLGRDP